jgi:RIO-like serine/threonine protein kinase
MTPELTTNQENVLEAVYHLSDRSLTVPAPFTRIGERVRPRENTIVADELEYLVQKGYLRKFGTNYNLTAHGLDYAKANFK